MNVLVQGGSGGLGSEMVRQYLARDAVTHVFATCRSPDTSVLTGLADSRLHLLALDVTDEASIESAAARVAELTDKLHVLVNVAGVLQTDSGGPERRLEQVNAAALAHYFAVNASGPLLVSRFFLPLLAHGERAVLANMSARVGSISDNRLGGWYGYRASKAAQNMMTRTLAIELKRRAPNLICVALHPGTVDTKLSKPFSGSVRPEQLFTPARAAGQLIDIIDSLQPEESGSFFDWQRSPIAW